MPSFRYSGRNDAGELVRGRIQAASIEAAASDLFGRSITPIDITEAEAETAGTGIRRVAGPGMKRLTDWLTGNKVGVTDLIIFTRQMYSLAKAGMPLDRALKGLEASISNPAMKKVLRDVTAELEKGMTLTDSLGTRPEVFPPLYLSLVHAGENTGRLDLAFQQVSKYLELERETVKQVRGAVRYPIFVLVAIAVALTLIMLFVIPVFADTFQQLNAQLPWQTVVLINVSSFFADFWPYLLFLAIATWLGFRGYINTPAGRRNWDRYKMRLPLAGSIFERVALSRFARMGAMMFRAGVPIVQSLGVISRAVGNRYIGENVEKMRDGIAHGESLYRTAVKSGMFSPLVLQMIAVGEESGSLAELLDEVADFYDAEVDYDLKKLSSSIEPILIVLIAGVVLILALGVFLPIWDLANAAG